MPVDGLLRRHPRARFARRRDPGWHCTRASLPDTAPIGYNRLILTRVGRHAARRAIVDGAIGPPGREDREHGRSERQSPARLRQHQQPHRQVLCQGPQPA